MPKRNEKEGALRWVQDKIDRLSAALAAVLESECREELAGVQPEIITGIRHAALDRTLRGLKYSAVTVGGQDEDSGTAGHSEASAPSRKQYSKGTRRGRKKKQQEAPPAISESGNHDGLIPPKEDSDIRMPGLTME